MVQRAGATAGRYSFPFFYDPAFESVMASCHHLLPLALQARARARRDSAPTRWDGVALDAFEGTYGEYLIGKVSKVFPELASKAAIEARARETSH